MAESKKEVIREKPIPEKKKKAVEELRRLFTESNTILIASIKNLPASQYQEIKKKLIGKAILKVPKKSIFIRAIDAIEKGGLKVFKKEFREDTAILFSDIDPFELSLLLSENKISAKAKPGQEAPEDIIVEQGPTDLPPGPAISELGAVGLQVAIEKGKISIKSSKTIVKKGEKISPAVADVMSKLDIRPLSIGFEPLVAYDSKEEKLYTDIKIDKEKTLEELKNSYVKAIALAVEIVYPSEESISFILAKASAHESAILKFISEDNKTKSLESWQDELKETKEEGKNE